MKDEESRIEKNTSTSKNLTSDHGSPPFDSTTQERLKFKTSKG